MHRAASLSALLGLAVALASSLVAAPAEAQAGPTRASVRQLLSGIEDVPTDADWRRVGDRALPLLIELYNDPREAPYVRLRAVGATAAFPVPAVRTFLRAVARAPEQSDLFVAEAVEALARGFGAAAVPDVAAFLGHEEPVVREAAARALARVGGDDARRALRERLRVEPLDYVRETLTRALR